jgi:hypothetical protein
MVSNFIHHDSIVDAQGRQHRSGRDPKDLKKESADYEGQNKSNNNGFKPI